MKINMLPRQNSIEPSNGIGRVVLPWILLDVFSKLIFGHGAFTTIARAARWHNIFSRITAAVDCWYLVFALKFNACLSAVVASMVMRFENFIPLLDSEGISQSAPSRNASLFVIVSTHRVGAAIIALILEKFGLVFGVIFLLIDLSLRLTRWLFIARSVKFIDMIFLFNAAGAFVISMILFHIYFAIASQAKTFSVLFFKFAAFFADDFLFAAPRNASLIAFKTKVFRASGEKFSAMLTMFFHDSSMRLVRVSVAYKGIKRK